MKTLCILVFLLAMCMPATSFSLDADREGFTFGGGIGFSPYSHYSFTGFFSDEYRSGAEDKIGLAFHLGAGHGISLEQVIRFEVNGTVMDDNTFGGTSVQTFVGLTYYHYLDFGRDTFHFMFGAGWYTLFSEATTSNKALMGGLLGIGYNLDYSTEVTLFLSTGHTEIDQADFKHLHFSLMLSKWVY